MTIWNGWTSVSDLEANFYWTHSSEDIICANKVLDPVLNSSGIVLFRQWGYWGLVLRNNSVNYGSQENWQPTYFDNHEEIDYYINSGWFAGVDLEELQTLIDSYNAR